MEESRQKQYYKEVGNLYDRQYSFQGFRVRDLISNFILEYEQEIYFLRETLFPIPKGKYTLEIKKIIPNCLMLLCYQGNLKIKKLCYKNQLYTICHPIIFEETEIWAALATNFNVMRWYMYPARGFHLLSEYLIAEAEDKGLWGVVCVGDFPYAKMKATKDINDYYRAGKELFLGLQIIHLDSIAGRYCLDDATDPHKTTHPFYTIAQSISWIKEAVKTKLIKPFFPKEKREEGKEDVSE